MPKEKKTFLIGAHMSIAKGAHNALLEGFEIGANIIQLFTASQRQWHAKSFSEEEIQLWEEARKKTGITHIMSHDSYLINLGSAKTDLLAKSRKAFSEEIKRCHQLKIDYLNFHPGSAVGQTEEKCLETIAESLLELKKEISKGKTKLLLETTAGQGSVVGYKFEHLEYIISRVEKEIPIGICLDTCHSFAAGYDLRNYEALDQTLKEFDKTIGLKYLKAFHVNDSVKGLGERKDRHANLGQGQIGINGFAALMQHPKTCYLPKYLETPDGQLHWKEEIKLLHQLGNKNEN